MREIVQAALGTDREINRDQRRRVANHRREVTHRFRRGIDRVNPLPRTIHEKILPHPLRRKLRRRRIVKRAARDRAADRVRGRMQIRVKRRRVRGVRKRRRPLPARPAEVRARAAEIDFLPRSETDISDEHQPRSGLKRERERIAQTQRPDRAVLPRRRRKKRIVLRNRTVRVEPHDFPQHRHHRGGICGPQIVADRDVEFSIQPEMQRARVVLRRVAERGKILKHHLAARQRDIATRGEAAHAIVKRRRARRVINVEPAVVREVRIERDPRQPALLKTNRVHRQKRRGQQHPILEEPHAPRLLADEQPPIRRERHAGRRRELARPQQLLLHKPRRQAGLRAHRARGEPQHRQRKSKNLVVQHVVNTSSRPLSPVLSWLPPCWREATLSPAQIPHASANRAAPRQI